MTRVQIVDWHGEDDWEVVTNNRRYSATTAQEIAEQAIDLFITEAAAYDRIGGDPATVRVDVDGVVTTWETTTEATWACYAREVRG